MTRHTAIVFFAQTPQIDRSNPDEPYTTLPWDELDAFFTACLGDLIENTSRIRDIDIQIYRNPAEISDDIFKPFGDRVRCFDSQEGPFTQQVKSAFDAAFAKHYKRVVVILDNQPSMNVKFFSDVLRQLGYEDDTIVVGPTTEGRCYLVGMKKNHSWIFDQEEADPMAKPDLLLQRICLLKTLLIPTRTGYVLNSGMHLARLKSDLDRMDETDSDFPRRTYSMFKMFDKKYKARKTAR